MSIEDVMKEPDPKARMIQMCGYLSVMSPEEVLPSNDILKCIEDLIAWAKKNP